MLNFGGCTVPRWTKRKGKVSRWKAQIGEIDASQLGESFAEVGPGIWQPYRNWEWEAWNFKYYAFWRWFVTPQSAADKVIGSLGNAKTSFIRKDWIEHMHLKSHVSNVSAKNDTWSVLSMVSNDSNVHHPPSNKKKGKTRRWRDPS